MKQVGFYTAEESAQIRRDKKAAEERKLLKEKQAQHDRNVSKKLLRNQKRADKYKLKNRNRATPAEKLLFKELQKRKIRFMFQKAYFTATKLFIIDFFIYCRGKNLAVEVDGGYHKKQLEYDNYRANWITHHRNCNLIRFTNEDVFNRMDYVIKEICKHKVKHTK